MFYLPTRLLNLNWKTPYGLIVYLLLFLYFHCTHTLAEPGKFLYKINDNGNEISFTVELTVKSENTMLNREHSDITTSTITAITTRLDDTLISQTLIATPLPESDRTPGATHSVMLPTSETLPVQIDNLFLLELGIVSLDIQSTPNEGASVSTVLHEAAKKYAFVQSDTQGVFFPSLPAFITSSGQGQVPIYNTGLRTWRILNSELLNIPITDNQSGQSISYSMLPDNPTQTSIHALALIMNGELTQITREIVEEEEEDYENEVFCPNSEPQTTQSEPRLTAHSQQSKSTEFNQTRPSSCDFFSRKCIFPRLLSPQSPLRISQQKVGIKINYQTDTDCSKPSNH